MDDKALEGNNRLNFEKLQITRPKTSHSIRVNGLTVINNLLVSGANDGIKIWDISSLEYIREIKRDPNIGIESLTSWNDSIMSWSLDENNLGIQSLTSWNDSIVGCSLDHTIKIWNLSNGSCIRTLNGHSGPVYCVILFNDQIVSGSADKTIKIWDPNNGNCLQTLTGHTHIVWCLCILNSDTIVSGSIDHSIKIWNVSSSTCISTLAGHTDTVRCLIVLNDLIISGSDDNTIKIWDPLNGNCISTLKYGYPNHLNWVLGLCVVDEQHFVSCSRDGTLKIWNISSDKCVKTLNCSNSAACVTFHENQIICGLDYGLIEMWRE